MFRKLIIIPALIATCHADDIAPLRTALEKQAQHKTVSVDVRQTKKIPALSEPIVLKGHLWLKPGQAFRWQLGKPTVQTAIYNGDKVYLMDDKNKTGLELDKEDRRAKPLMLMLGIGEGASFEQLEKTFTIAGTNTVREHFIVSMMPKGRLKKAIKSMVMQVNTKNSFLERIEYTQRDGTVVITEFYPPVLNKSLPSGIFEVKKDGYTWE
ncbi:MAG: LolA family protein [Luteolibacter sp.]